MHKKILTFLIGGFVAGSVMAQDLSRSSEPFLFSVSPLTQNNSKWNLDYSGSYGERVSGPFGFEGLTQQFSVKGNLGYGFTVYANSALGISSFSKSMSAQQAEVLHDLVGLMGFRLGAGFGFKRDFSNVKSLFSRITLFREASNWEAGGNMIFERPFAMGRDQMDIITSVGFQHRIAGNLFAGVEAIGEDLEGFWDPQEAEGGAKMMVGPSLNFSPKQSRLSFSLSGGPVIYATKNQYAIPGAMRELSTQSGWTVRTRVAFNFR